MPTVLLAYYCALVLLASIAGGMIPQWMTLTHRRMELAVSFVAGVMLGVSVMIMLPHAIIDAAPGAGPLTHAKILKTMTSLLAGVLVMFLIERFFSFHHHDAPNDELPENDPSDAPTCHHDHDHAPHHDITWSGAAVGMTLHSIVDGVALAASVQHSDERSWLAGFGTFLVILLHKPFDSLTIGMLMARGKWSTAWRSVVNGLFALAIPVGVLLFYFLQRQAVGGSENGAPQFISHALAFSAGTFLCISLSDLLPELQFHQHDRVKLTMALALGLAVAYVAARLEAATHTAHQHSATTVTVPSPPSPIPRPANRANGDPGRRSAARRIPDALRGA
jgi:zinc and cadmium transporter